MEHTFRNQKSRGVSDKVQKEYAAVGNVERQQILWWLSQGAMCGTELCVVLDVSQPQMSKHLRILREAGLITRVPGKGAQRKYVQNTEKVNAMALTLFGLNVPRMERARLAKKAARSTV